MMSNENVQVSNENPSTNKFVSNSILNFSVSGYSPQLSTGKNVILTDVNRGDFSIEARGDLNAKIFDNIKAHFNPSFEGSESSPVPISDGGLNPEKYSAISFKDNSQKKGKKYFGQFIPGKER
ncbi:hypothetical protein ES332_A03G044300v1 [Gossypium tomentosum]|uniref:Uncharacterized protein n=1 Tax=Gossypium tomentosum TaxID=34277 RepID=A0A5D2R3L9_GOSTO|nr:hypothetical protein ES332_A03G044300v1 [Gossypium tomentosum]